MRLAIHPPKGSCAKEENKGVTASKMARNSDEALGVPQNIEDGVELVLLRQNAVLQSD